MSSYSRRNLLIALASLPLAACGFEPVYRAGGRAEALHGNIRFNLIESPEGFALLERLENRLGVAGANAPYKAEIELVMEDTELTLVASTGLIRHTLSGYAMLTVRNGAGDVVFTDKQVETVGYSENLQTVVTYGAKKDATERLTRSLADKIVLRIAASASSWAA